MNKLVTYSLIFGVLFSNTVFADGEAKHERSASDVGADASIADRRLPPVFPGEEVHDGNKTIKVWSTAGEVPVSQPPEPWRNSNDQDAELLRNGVGVVVDGRPTDRR